MKKTVEHGEIARQVLSPAKFAVAIDTGINRVHALLRANRIRHVRYGRRIVIPLTEVGAFLERESVGGQK